MPCFQSRKLPSKQLRVLYILHGHLKVHARWIGRVCCMSLPVDFSFESCSSVIRLRSSSVYLKMHNTVLITMKAETYRLDDRTPRECHSMIDRVEVMKVLLIHAAADVDCPKQARLLHASCPPQQSFPVACWNRIRVSDSAVSW